MYNAYAIETTKMFVEEYGWFNMPMTVHKVLIHGTIIISSTLLPIGQLTEEAQEARNKDIRKYRQYHTRKSSRRNSNQNLLNRLLCHLIP